jgi:hypothetical protein
VKPSPSLLHNVATDQSTDGQGGQTIGCTKYLERLAALELTTGAGSRFTSCPCCTADGLCRAYDLYASRSCRARNRWEAGDWRSPLWWGVCVRVLGSSWQSVENHALRI